MRITAICNQKGGVGKTTVAVGLVEELVLRGRRTLLIDADPQANATARLGVEVGENTTTLNDVLFQGALPGSRVEPGALTHAIAEPSLAWQTEAGLLDVVPSELNLGDREYDQALGREMRLRTALAGLSGRYDEVVIDCPPNLGQLTYNALLAASHVVCVTEPRADSVDGLRQMIAVIDQVRGLYNPGLLLAGIVVNRFTSTRTDPVAWLGKLEEEHREDGLLITPALDEREFVAKAATEAQPLSSMQRTPAGIRAHVREAFAAIVERLDAR